ncbi:hypothetical protein RAJCM14343_3846 [Rhodococcus aetherivorans]|uniref:Uncharacterized protein n=1 Tax=Rhodococcus aetherivorans TaxID=191292 RepID=A0ABQ0YQ54_9NOCA|nr:hypothetical protein RAJCM14343_3846 [Rhodococcus aetherivorans]
MRQFRADRFGAERRHDSVAAVTSPSGTDDIPGRSTAGRPRCLDRICVG